MTKIRQNTRSAIQASKLTLLIHREAVTLQPDGRIHTDNISTSSHYSDSERKTQRLWSCYGAFRIQFKQAPHPARATLSERS
jgi:hypothetical protein